MIDDRRAQRHILMSLHQRPSRQGAMGTKYAGRDRNA
jgi:hypothetical protein